MSKSAKKMSVYPDAAKIIASSGVNDSELSEITNISRPSIRKLKNREPVTESVYNRFVTAMDALAMRQEGRSKGLTETVPPVVSSERTRPRSQLQLLELIKKDLELLKQSLGWLGDDAYAIGLKLNRDQVGPVAQMCDEIADKSHRILNASI